MRSLLLSFLVLPLLALPAEASAAPTRTYVSLGDSYAVGYQPDMGSTRDGFPNQTVSKARKRGWKLKLVNFGCGGATTTSILQQKGCPKAARALGAPAYKSTQVAAAVKYLRAHRRKVALITVSISGNDVTACARAAEPVPCVAAAVTTIRQNVSDLAAQLHKAAPKARLVGTTYPDVILGEIVRPGGNVQLAGLSVVAFQSLINPALKDSYEKSGGKLVDVTAASGAYTPLDQTTTLEPYGTIPQAVAQVCQLTWYCSKGDIHANRAGYGLIADLVAGQLPKR